MAILWDYMSLASDWGLSAAAGRGTKNGAAFLGLKRVRTAENTVIQTNASTQKGRQGPGHQIGLFSGEERFEITRIVRSLGFLSILNVMLS